MMQRNSTIAILFCLAGITMFIPACVGQDNGKPATTQQAPAQGKKKIVGGGCDGCELMYIGMPGSVKAIDTSPGWKEKGTQLIISGTAFKADAQTPAPGIIIYYWQTDNNGYYSPAPGLDARAKRHGHIRGWVKSDSNGQYSIYTIRPAPYPGEDMPAHIHLSILEPGVPNEYYIDEMVFDDDPLLTTEKRRKMENRGGSGILKVEKRNGKEYAQHKFVAGLNIPGY